MSEVKVSVVIPFHNVEEYLETSLKSVVNQTLGDIEIICINDASDDGSGNIVWNFAQNDGRIKIINLETRQGQGYARNIGIENATGKYIGFVDADDWVDTSMFEKLYNRAEELNSDISMCKTILFNEKSQKEEFEGYYQLNALEKFFDKSFNPYEIKDNLLNFNVAIWNKIYKTEFLKNLNIRFPAGFIYEDLPFFFETILKSTNLSIVNDNLYYYRINRPGSTMQNVGDKILNRIDMLERAFEHIKNSTFYSEIETPVINWLVEDIFHRASIIEEEYFEKYFFKSKEFLEKIGFSSDSELKNRGIIFFDEVLFWLELEPRQALFFTRTLRSTDKKLDKLYSELGNSYNYINYKTGEISQETQQIKTQFNELKTSTDSWSEHFNREFTQVYNNLTNQTGVFEETMNKLLYLQKEEISKENEFKKAETEARFEKALKNLEEQLLDKNLETVHNLKAEFEEEKRAMTEEFDKRFNEQRVKYERKIIKLEEDYNNFYRKLKPVIKLLRFLGLTKKEDRNGRKA
ncbi:glycosyltransferase [bacterium]|nr:glycosyltransferase [bacterium]